MAQTTTGRLWSYEISQPGVLASGKGVCVANTLASLDSMAIEADGTVVVAALRDGLLVVRPDGSHDFLRVDGPLITNVAFSREGDNVAYITESAIGSLVAIEWPRSGLELAYSC